MNPPISIERGGDPPRCGGRILEAVSDGPQRDPIAGLSVCAELLPADGGDAVVQGIIAEDPRVVLIGVVVKEVEGIIDVVGYFEGEVAEIGQN